MNNRFFYFIIFCFLVIGFAFTKPVFALDIDEPKLSGVEYVSDSSVKILYKTNNTNPDYKVQIYNMTNGKYYSETITSNSYTVTGLTAGKTYNFIIRVYYKTTVSNWSDPVSGTPKLGIPSVTSITPGDKQLTLNYSTNGSSKEVEIYIANLKKSVKTSNLSTATLTGLTNGTKYGLVMRNCYDDGKCGGWSNIFYGTPNVVVTPAPATPTVAQRNQSAINGAINWAIKYANNNAYKYKKWTSNANTHKCPLCHPGSGNGWNCIGFVSAAYHHGAGYSKVSCSNSGLLNDSWANSLYKKNNSNALSTWRSRNGNDWNLVAKGTSKIAQSKLAAGDVLICYSGSTYKHTALYIGNGKIADATSSKGISIRNYSSLSGAKIAFRFTGTGKF